MDFYSSFRDAWVSGTTTFKWGCLSLKLAPADTTHCVHCQLVDRPLLVPQWITTETETVIYILCGSRWWSPKVDRPLLVPQWITTETETVIYTSYVDLGGDPPKSMDQLVPQWITTETETVIYTSYVDLGGNPPKSMDHCWCRSE